MRAHDVDFVRRRSGRDAAGTLQHVEDALRALIGQDALRANDLADQVEVAAVVFDDANAHPVVAHSGEFSQAAHGFRDGQAFYTQTSQVAQIDATVRSDLAPAFQTYFAL